MSFSSGLDSNHNPLSKPLRTPDKRIDCRHATPIAEYVGHNSLPAKHRSHPWVWIEVLGPLGEIGEPKVQYQNYADDKEVGEQGWRGGSAEDDLEDGEEAVQTVQAHVDEPDIGGGR